MDLKDVIFTLEGATKEASLAYHAGHPEQSHSHLAEAKSTIDAYFENKDIQVATTAQEPDQDEDQKPAEKQKSSDQEDQPPSQ